MSMNHPQHQPCPVCERGQLFPQIGDYVTTLPDGEKLVVPGINFSVCGQCGEEAITLAESRKVEAFVAEHLELLTPAELRAIRESLGVDQTEMSEALGLGSKTFHRWEKGNQIPSRSMGYYLRVLQKHPEMFEFVRERRWRLPDNVIPVNFREAFPSLPEANVPPLPFNPARSLYS